jgi:hypothetical protein
VRGHLIVHDAVRDGGSDRQDQDFGGLHES